MRDIGNVTFFDLFHMISMYLVIPTHAAFQSTRKCPISLPVIIYFLYKAIQLSALIMIAAIQGKNVMTMTTF